MPRPEDDFYVGYLPLPRMHRRFLMMLVPLAVVVLAGVIVTSAGVQRDPGPAVWETGDATTWEGTLVADPFPRLLDEQGSLLLVEAGKHGSSSRAAPHVGRQVRVTGHLLQRGDLRVLELAPGDAAFKDVGTGGLVGSGEALGETEIAGEILDAKCYLGAMKPGEGKGHKACAMLCIAGGIPALLRGVDATGEVHDYLLIGDDADGATEVFIDYVGEPVHVRANVERRGSLLFARVGEGDVSRP